MLYELINPSDPYTFEAKDRETAALTVFLFSTSYGAHCLTEEREDNDVPILVFGNAGEWYQDIFKRTPTEGMDSLKDDVIESLDSFVYGHAADRKIYQTAIDNISDSNKQKEFARQWHEKRTSLNDIGQRARDFADRLRNLVPEE